MRSPAQLDLDCKLIEAELDLHFAASDSEISPAALDHLEGGSLRVVDIWFLR